MYSFTCALWLAIQVNYLICRTLFTGLDLLSEILKGDVCFMSMVKVGYQSYILYKIQLKYLEIPG